MRELIRSIVRPTALATAVALAFLLCLAPRIPLQAAGADATTAGKGVAGIRGGDLCDLLAPRDFDAVGVKDARPPTSNSTPPTDYYCVYAGRSSATGGVEFDAFVADSAADAATVFKTVGKETAGPSALDRAKALGVDAALLSLEAPGNLGPFATIVVRNGTFVFAIGFPSGPQAEPQLLALARTVIQRGAQLSQ